MSQQFQTVQPSYQAQTPAGQGLQQSTLGQAVGQRFSDSVPQEVQQAVMDLDRFETIVEWAKSRAVERGRVRIAQRCDDLAELAHLQKNLILRGSPFAHPVGQATKQTIQQGIQELQAYVSQPEVQEALAEAQQSTASIDNALARLQSWGQQYGTGQPYGAGTTYGMGAQTGGMEQPFGANQGYPGTQPYGAGFGSQPSPSP